MAVTTTMLAESTDSTPESSTYIYTYVRSGTGLDDLVLGILGDAGLSSRISTDDIRGGADAAGGLNRLIKSAIIATGVANDGEISVGDIYALNDWIQENRYAQFVRLHGDDEDGVETGFHLVQNDGSTGLWDGQNLVNTISDGLYHIGFDIVDGRFTNEDGDANISVSTAADWLNDLLARDLELGRLSNDEIVYFETGTSGTGLDILVDLVAGDSGLSLSMSDGELSEAAEAADGLVNILVRAIRSTGADDDGVITVSDLYSINGWIREYRAAHWERYYGTSDGATGEETGFLSVEGDGARTQLFGENAINDVADALFRLGFEIESGRVTDGQGNKGESLETVANWLTQILRGDFASGDMGRGVRDAIAAAVDVSEAPSMAAQGTGLRGFVWDRGSSFSNIQDLIAYTKGEAITHRFDASAIDFGAGYDDYTLETFIGEAGSLTRGDGESDMSTIGMRLTGYIYISEGWHDVSIYSDDGFQLRLNGAVFSEKESGYGETVRGAYFEGGLYKIDLYYYENWGGQALSMEIDGNLVSDAQLYQSVEDYTSALATYGALETPLAGQAVVEADTAPETAGSGLVGTIYTGDTYFSSLDDLKARMSALESGEDGSALAETHAFMAGLVDFGGASHSGRVEDFLSGAAQLTSGAGGESFTYMAVTLEGYVYIPEGYHTLTVWSDDGFELSIGGEVLTSYKWGRSLAPSSATRWFEGGLYKIDLLYYENGGSEGLRLELDGDVMGTDAFYASVEDFEDAQAGNPPTAVRLIEAGPRAAATTGTGLDVLVETILNDDGLNARLDDATISRAAKSANTLNELLIEAIRKTGIANDGKITGSDLWAISDYIRSDPDREAAYLDALGDNADQLRSDATGPIEQAGTNGDDNMSGTAGEDILNGGAGNDVIRGGLGLDVIDAGRGDDRVLGGADRDVIDAGAGDDRVDGEGGADIIRAGDGNDIVSGGAANDLVEGGDGNDRILGDEGRDWLYGEAGNDDIRGGTGDDIISGGTGSDILRGDEGNDQLDGGADRDEVYGGDGDDSLISVSDEANDSFHGGAGADGFHVQITSDGDGNLIGIGVDTILDFDLSEGDQIQLHGEGVSVSRILARVDGDGKAFTAIYLEGPSGEYLGRLHVYGDAVSEADLVFTDTPILEASLLEGRAMAYGTKEGSTLRDGRGEQVLIGTSGDDQFYAFGDGGEPDAWQLEEAGIDYSVYGYEPYGGAGDVMFGGEGHDTFTFIIPIAARVNILAEHAGSSAHTHGSDIGGNEMNMDGDAVSWHGVAGENQNLHDHWVDGIGWGNVILDYNASEDTIEVLGHTTEILSVEYVDEDGDGTYDYSVIYPYSNQGAGAHNGDRLGSIIVYGDLVDINDIVTDRTVHYGTDLLEGANPLSAETLEAREEVSGIFTVVDNGGSSRLFDESAIYTVLEAIYAVGTGVVDGDVVDGASLIRGDSEEVASWLNTLLADELAEGSLTYRRADPEDRPDGTGTGLDALVDAIYNDEGLQANIPLAHMIAAAEAANTISGLIVAAIQAKDLYSDGNISTADVYAINEWIRADEARYELFVEAHGDDENQFLEWGFHYAQNDGATSRLFGDNALNTVADGIFHIGFEIDNGRFYNEDGNANARVETVAAWINQLLALSGDSDILIPKAVATDTAVTESTEDGHTDMTVILQDEWML